MNEIEFEAFPKLARLSRNCIITEKIDGANAQIIITTDGEMACGSRTRLITPKDDNFGFARWAYERKEELVAKLGPGRHFGEWWGCGIQRGYGLKEKRFSLFNAKRWEMEDLPEGVYTVPILFEGLFDTLAVDNCINELNHLGSIAAAGFMKPEGVVIFHIAGNVGFKKTIEKDEVPKGSKETV